MALSDEFVAAHVERWQQTLTSPIFPHRRVWPGCLFHHAPLENALSILRTGVIRSRSDPANPHQRDVAAREVNQARDHAHDRVRLYFRPRTPTQYNIEGIRKPGECRFGDETHAPFLVMFVLDARPILTLPDVSFSDRNMQAGAAVPGNTEDYFASIPFDKVFHEGSTLHDNSITTHRCAEVLPPSPLDLTHCLRAVYFRSEPERDTFLYHLGGADRVRWPDRFLVSGALQVFEKRYSFVQEIGLTREGVVFTLNPRHDRRGVEVRISVTRPDGAHVAQFYDADLQAAPPQGRWIYHHAFAAGEYVVHVDIDGHLAFRAPISLFDALF